MLILAFQDVVSFFRILHVFQRHGLVSWINLVLIVLWLFHIGIVSSQLKCLNPLQCFTTFTITNYWLKWFPYSWTGYTWFIVVNLLCQFFLQMVLHYCSFQIYIHSSATTVDHYFSYVIFQDQFLDCTFSLQQFSIFCTLILLRILVSNVLTVDGMIMCMLQVTCLTVHENLNCMAVGFENGSIVLFRGDVMRERYAAFR